MLEHIRRIGTSTSPFALIELLNEIISENAEVRNAARESVVKLIEKATPTQLAKLDRRVRASTTDLYFEKWRLKPADLEKLATDASAVLLLGLASFHGNGRIREAAVRHLSSLHDGRGIGFLVIRANDWVEPVRKAAQRTLLEWLITEYASGWVKSLPLIARLEQCGRGEHSGLVAKVFELLGSTECREALREGLKATDQNVRQACLYVVKRMPFPAAEPLLDGMLRSPDPLLRLHGTTILLAHSSVEQLDALAGRLQLDPFMPIRRAGVEAAVERSAPGASNLLFRALTDRHASMRELARFYLHRTGTDVRGYYLSLIHRGDTPVSAVALLGLGESGQPEDFTYVRPYLTVDNTQVRVAALAAVGRLAPAQAQPFLMLALADPCPAVSRQAERSLGSQPGLAPEDKLFNLLGNGNLPHIRRNAFRLLQRGNKWERLAPLLVALNDEDSNLRDRAHSAIGTWLLHYTRSYLQPSQSQVQSAQAALDRCKSQLPKGIFRELEALLADWRK